MGKTLGQIKCITCAEKGEAPNLMVIPDLGRLSVLSNLGVVNEIMIFIFETHREHQVRADYND